MKFKTGGDLDNIPDSYLAHVADLWLLKEPDEQTPHISSSKSPRNKITFKNNL